MPLPEEPEEQRVYDAPPAAIESFDREAVQPTSTSPALSEAPGAFGDTSGDDGEPPPSEPIEELDAPPEFDPKYREPFKGLLYIGSLKSTFHWLGHEFSIRTLKTGELAELGVLTKRYQGTDWLLKAQQSAVLAACLISIDGEPLPEPVHGGTSIIESRLKYVMREWHPAVIDKVWQEYTRLEMTVRETVAAMEKAYGEVA